MAAKNWGVKDTVENEGRAAALKKCDRPEDYDIKGRKSITDRPSRFIYYPSHSFPENPDSGVLLASYTWSDDSLLFLGLEDEELKEVALRECSFMESRSGTCAQGWW
ncbi:hypothetical protein NHX12_013910 [Muraenolepis orangiensis]|uniref:Amine oxidase domain-containing protein n=1 Tax=Muraenolepis orangiensis TaxID=630683 RepID=A0A9Q0I442_9TELE|nr:hypothetical protein NHX12_013910 [Muraenolepis orangiensis]